MSVNYTDVLEQLKNVGILVDRLELGRIVRRPVEGDREKRGWYNIREVTLAGGEIALVGSFGVWHGNESNTQKIELKKIDLSPEQKAAIRRRFADDKKRAEFERKKTAEAAALKADKKWRALHTDGDCTYLHSKGISAHGVRFTKDGAMAVPMLDSSGRIQGLQFILDKTTHKEKIEKYNGRDKIYWPPGVAKKGHFHLIGSPKDLLLIAEGYATASSLFEATGHAVAVAFDAGNLEPVARALRKRYPRTRILICADDDAFAHCPNPDCKHPVNINDSANCPHCEKPHKKINTGCQMAELAAAAVNGHFITPRFADPAARLDHYARSQGKLTDFNDQHLTDGLHTVLFTVESMLQQWGWQSAKARAETQQVDGVDKKLTPIDTTDELLDRFSLIYGKSGTVFDHVEHMLLALSDMRDACRSRETHRRWQESPNRKIVRAENVGFDPTETDEKILCNLWSGWPTQPEPGCCDALLDMLYHMCSGEEHAMDTASWVIKWLAFPLQHPGAKMRTTIVVHGPQGTGKNLFFESIMEMYAHYGRIIDQAAIEDKHNEWASAKLFMIADEVVARSDIYHVKNKLKGFITGKWIRINPKNITAYEEKNHVNIVFLSNERMPVVIEEDDRRHCVIWTPPKKNKAYYKVVSEQIKDGGVAALHHWLLNIDLGDFDEYTEPPMTNAKEELLNLAKDNIFRFYDDWINGDIDGVPNVPVLSEDIYDLYKYWCVNQGVRHSPMNRAVDHLAKRPGVYKVRKRFMDGIKQSHPKFFIFPLGHPEMNPGTSEQVWLGRCVEDFRSAVREYKYGVAV